MLRWPIYDEALLECEVERVPRTPTVTYKWSSYPNTIFLISNNSLFFIAFHVSIQAQIQATKQLLKKKIFLGVRKYILLVTRLGSALSQEGPLITSSQLSALSANPADNPTRELPCGRQACWVDYAIPQIS